MSNRVESIITTRSAKDDGTAASKRRSSSSDAKSTSSDKSERDDSGASRRRSRLSTGEASTSPCLPATPNGNVRSRLVAGNDTAAMAMKRTPVKESPKSVNSRKRSMESPGPVSSVPPKLKKVGKNDGSGNDNKNDYFCWLCCKDGTLICCEVCPRVYHQKCLGLPDSLPKDWVCPECEKIMRAECADSRSRAMSLLTLDQLCTLLKFGLQRMRQVESDPFEDPVDVYAVPTYTNYIYYPMELSTLEKNIKKKLYGSTEAFLADVKWILHNCIIFNGLHHKLTSVAKSIVKICKHEMNEIEVCPDCYTNSCDKQSKEWFCEPCRKPHTLVWAKLKGYPFWPAKLLREAEGQVDVRFFGAHDRSWVPVSTVFLLSKEPPAPARAKKGGGFDVSMQEVKIHVRKLREKFGSWEYPAFRTPYDRKSVAQSRIKLKQKESVVKKKFKLVTVSSKPVSSSDNEMSGYYRLLAGKRAYKGIHRPKIKHTETKADKQSRLQKQATAVKSKYNCIITTRAAKRSETVTTATAETERSQVLIASDDSSLESQAAALDLNLAVESAAEVAQKTDTDISTSAAMNPVVVVNREQKTGNNIRTSAPTNPVVVVNREQKTDNNIRTSASINPVVVVKGEKEREQKYAIVDKNGPKISIIETAAPCHVSPAKTVYLEKLEKTISSCKENLRLSSVNDAENVRMSTDSDASEASGKVDQDSQDGGHNATNSETVMKSEPFVANNTEVLVVKNNDTKSIKVFPVESLRELIAKPLSKNPIPETAKPEIATKTNQDEPRKTGNSDGQLPPLVGHSSSSLEDGALKMDVDSDGEEANLVIDMDATSPDAAVSANTSADVKPTMKSLPGEMRIRGRKNPTPVPILKKAAQRHQSTETITAPIIKRKNDPEATTQEAKTQAIVDKFTDKMLKTTAICFKTLFGEMVKEFMSSGLVSKNQYKSEVESLQWRHQQELTEIKHNLDLTLAEMKSCWDVERTRVIAETKKQCASEKEKLIQETKKKQWCSNCAKEAVLYCCWNTSYCDYPCQQAHWPEHMPLCSQNYPAEESKEEGKGAPQSQGSWTDKPQPNVQAMYRQDDEVAKARNKMHFIPPSVGNIRFLQPTTSTQGLPTSTMSTVNPLAQPVPVQYLGQPASQVNITPNQYPTPSQVYTPLPQIRMQGIPVQARMPAMIAQAQPLAPNQTLPVYSLMPQQQAHGGGGRLMTAGQLIINPRGGTPTVQPNTYHPQRF